VLDRLLIELRRRRGGAGRISLTIVTGDLRVRRRPEERQLRSEARTASGSIWSESQTELNEKISRSLASSIQSMASWEVLRALNPLLPVRPATHSSASRRIASMSRRMGAASSMRQLRLS